MSRPALLPAAITTVVLLAGTACTATRNHGSTGTSAPSPPASASAPSSAASSEPPIVPVTPGPPPGPATSGGPITDALVPLPVAASTDAAATFTLDAGTRVAVESGAGAAAVGDQLAGYLRPATGFALPVETVASRRWPDDAIVLTLDAGAAPDTAALLGTEGYDLTVSSDRIVIVATKAAGLFYGVQTLRQLLPAAIESSSVQPGPWRVTGGRIVDYPRFSYRGAMLDVARHFFTVAQVEQFIDELVPYKVNVLHLHLSDDQGWRIAIDAWPNLATHGGSTQVGGGPGGYYTKADYRAIVQYAQERFVTVVPEIDAPAHVGAALSSYPELNCNGVAPPLYTGEHAAVSALCLAKPVTYQFLDDVVAELAQLTPGPFIDLGGDEAQRTPASEYLTYVQRAQAIVQAHGKRMMGWAGISKGTLDPGTVAEYWDFTDHGASEKATIEQGAQVVAAPADHAYLDQKYAPSSPLGLDWAGPIDVEQAYSWDPTDGGLATDAQLLGVEAPLWSETIRSMADAEYLTWPRMAGIAEIGWTPQTERSWAAYEPRLARQAPRWAQLGIGYYRSTQVAWAP